MERDKEPLPLFDRVRHIGTVILDYLGDKFVNLENMMDDALDVDFGDRDD